MNGQSEQLLQGLCVNAFIYIKTVGYKQFVRNLTDSHYEAGVYGV